MTTNFMPIRLDRLKYDTLSDLYEVMLSIVQNHDPEALHIQRHAELFAQKAELLGKLESKASRAFARDSYLQAYSRLDTLISALLQHVKALRRADFENTRQSVQSVENLLRKHFSQFVYVGQKKKKLMLSDFQFYVKTEDKDSYMQQMRQIGVEPYILEIDAICNRIKEMDKAKKNFYKSQSDAKEAAEAKAELVKSIRMLLTAIDLAALTCPELDYAPLINRLNLELKQNRTQIRNLETRRKRKKERENE